MVKVSIKIKYTFILAFTLLFYFLRCVYGYNIPITFYKTATDETTKILNVDGVLSSENIDYPAKYFKIVSNIPLKNNDLITLYWRANKNYNGVLYIHDLSGKIYGNVTIPYPQNTFMYSNITLSNIDYPLTTIYLSDMGTAGVYEISIDLFKIDRIQGEDTLIYTLKNNTIYKYVYRDDLGFILDAQSEYFQGGVLGLNKDSFDDYFIYFGSTNLSNPDYCGIVQLDIDTLQVVNKSPSNFRGCNYFKVSADFYNSVYISYYNGVGYSYAVKLNKSSLTPISSYSTSSILADSVLVDDFYVITRANNAGIYRLYKENMTIRNNNFFNCLSSYPAYLRADNNYIYTSCYVYYGGSNSTTQFYLNLTPKSSFEGGALNVYPDKEFVHVAKTSFFEKRLTDNLTYILAISNNYTGKINNIINYLDEYLFFNDEQNVYYVDRDFINNQGVYIIEGQNNLINIRRGVGGYSLLPPTLLYTPGNRSIPYYYYVIENPSFYFDNYNRIKIKYINPITKNYTYISPGESREYEFFIIRFVNNSFVNVSAKNKDYSFYLYFVAYNDIGETETRFIISINQNGYLVTPEEYQEIKRVPSFLSSLSDLINRFLPDSSVLTTKEKYTYVLVIFLVLNLIFVFGFSGFKSGELFQNKALSYILLLFNFLLFIFFISIGYIGVITMIILVLIIVFIFVLKISGGS